MFEATTFKAQHIQIRKDFPAGPVKDIERLGLVLDDPDGYLRLEHLTLGHAEAVITRVCSTDYKGAMRDDANFTFVLQRAGRYDVQIGGQDYAMLPGSLLAFRPNERRVQVRAGKTGIRAGATLQVPVARMHRLAQAMETTTDAAFPQDGNALQGEAGLTLSRVLPQLADDLFLHPVPLPPRLAQAIRQLIDEVLCEMIGRTVEHPPLRRIFPAFTRVRQAEAMMHAQSDEPISILEVAEMLEVSLRSLQLAFAEVYGGLSPREVLNRIRLEKARQRLLAAKGEGQVTTVAMDSGFFHLGRFSQAYARAFGEKPSETLLRRRS